MELEEKEQCGRGLQWTGWMGRGQRSKVWGQRQSGDLSLIIQEELQAQTPS